MSQHQSSLWANHSPLPDSNARPLFCKLMPVARGSIIPGHSRTFNPVGHFSSPSGRRVPRYSMLDMEDCIRTAGFVCKWDCCDGIASLHTRSRAALGCVPLASYVIAPGRAGVESSRERIVAYGFHLALGLAVCSAIPKALECSGLPQSGETL